MKYIKSDKNSFNNCLRALPIRKTNSEERVVAIGDSNRDADDLNEGESTNCTRHECSRFTIATKSRSREIEDPFHLSTDSW